MSSRVSIYDRSGKILTEIDVTFRRSWKLNEYGSGTFIMSLKDAKAIVDYLQFGNYVYCEHAKLPTWGGMIDTPRLWGEGKVTSTVYSSEYLLTTRISDRVFNTSGTWGAIFEDLLSNVWDNADYNPVKIGSIYGGGASTKREYNLADLYSEVKKLVQESGNDYAFEPMQDVNGRLYFQADWFKKRGMTRQFVFYEDKHIKLSPISLREQGRIANRLSIFGDGATYMTRPLARRNDFDSISKYGPRFMAEAAGGVTIDQLNDIADAKLIEYAEPRKTFDLTILDVSDAFQNIRIGDSIPIELYTVGFTGAGVGLSTSVRIKQMDYDEENNQVKLVADEVL